MISPKNLDTYEAKLVSQYVDELTRTITLVFCMVGVEKNTGKPNCYWSWSQLSMTSGAMYGHGIMTQGEWRTCEKVAVDLAYKGEPYCNKKHSHIALNSFYAEVMAKHILKNKGLGMPNMHHCRFQNTANDLAECKEALDNFECLSEEERRARTSIINMCKEIAKDFGDYDFTVDDINCDENDENSI